MNWISGRFKKAFPNTWTNNETSVEYLNYAEPFLKINKPEDWYRVSKQQVRIFLIYFFFFN